LTLIQICGRIHCIKTEIKVRLREERKKGNPERGVSFTRLDLCESM
jgi:hypothetical protein